MAEQNMYTLETKANKKIHREYRDSRAIDEITSLTTKFKEN